MKIEGLTERVRSLAEPVAEGLGLEIVHVEWAVEHGARILRVYIDKPGGVTIDDCSLMSRELSTILDVEDPIPESYSLEVSSPGLDRPLVREGDFARFTGRKAGIRTREPLGGRRNFKVTIDGVEEGVVVATDSEGRRLRIPLSFIERARLVAEV
ncbi:MAG: ribosome maturation factor RimP [Thermodesulfobacteriota bacterium]